MRCVIFDFDGTLVDSVGVILKSSEITCRELGIPYDPELIRSLIGLPLLQTGEILLGSGGGQAYLDIYTRSFLALAGRETKLFPGIKELLDELIGKPVALVTAKNRIGLEASLKILDLENYFSAISTASDGHGFKPEPGPALAVLSQLGEAAREAIFVGDSIFDIQCGQAAGTKTCAVSWGSTPRKSLSATNPDYLVDKVEELRKLLLKQLSRKGVGSRE